MGGLKNEPPLLLRHRADSDGTSQSQFQMQPYDYLPPVEHLRRYKNSWKL